MRIVVVEVEFEPVSRDQARVPRVAYVPLTAVSMLSAVDLPDGRRAWRLTVHGHEVPEPITDASGLRLRRALQEAVR